MILPCKIDVACPYCSFVNTVGVEDNGQLDDVILCNLEDGGCGKFFLARFCFCTSATVYEIEKQEYVLEVDVYNVRDFMIECNIMHESRDYPDWFEYRVIVTRKDGSIVEEFDSLVETYNGIQKLSYDEAVKGAEEIEHQMREKYES